MSTIVRNGKRIVVDIHRKPVQFRGTYEVSTHGVCWTITVDRITRDMVGGYCHVATDPEDVGQTIEVPHDWRFFPAESIPIPDDWVPVYET